jgi:prepilin-type processing-associated H-X9-DG protein
MATYTIIGSDQKQYGSVTADDVCRWIAEGRLNEQSLMKAPGETEFRPLATFPEFADAFAAKAAQAIEPPPVSAESIGPAKTSGLAIASLVLGILGVFTCGVTALIGLVLGIIAMIKVKQSRGVLSGGGIALAGTIVSAIFVFMIPIFAAMLLPALAAAKQKAQSINCISNVKGLAFAVRMYADENQNHYPFATNWCDALLKSNAGLTNIFHCPADFSGSRCSYAFNARLSGVEEGKVDPNTVVIFEANGDWNISDGRELILAKPRHGHLIAVGFADGHAEMVSESRLADLRWEP